jgi:hypothetical protein
MRDQGSIPGGILMWNRDSPVSLSRYIGDPDVIDHCGLVWGGRHPKPLLGRRGNNVIIPLDLTQLSCPGFTLAGGPPSCFTTDIVGCWRGPCGEPAISLHSNKVSLVQWVTRFLPIMRDPDPTPRGGYLCKTRILLLVLSRYNTVYVEGCPCGRAAPVRAWTSRVAQHQSSFYSRRRPEEDRMGRDRTFHICDTLMYEWDICVLAMYRSSSCHRMSRPYWVPPQQACCL